MSKLYDAVLYGMALAAGVLMAAMMVTICLDVLLRNLGGQSSAHFFTFSEYALLLLPCLGGPWLVREKAHVCVEIVLMHLSPRAQRWAARLINLLCITTCAVLAWYALRVVLRDFQLREMDSRSFDMPRWLLTATIPLCFSMMALEFARLLVRGESVLPGAQQQPVAEL